MSDFTYATVCISAAAQQAAQADLSDGFFNTGLSADGTEPATHYMTSGPWDSAELSRVCNPAPDGFAWEYRIAFGQDWQSFIDSLGLKMVVPVE